MKLHIHYCQVDIIATSIIMSNIHVGFVFSWVSCCHSKTGPFHIIGGRIQQFVSGADFSASAGVDHILA